MQRDIQQPSQFLVIALILERRRRVGTERDVRLAVRPLLDHAEAATAAASLHLQVDEKDDRKLEPLGGVHRHQIHRARRFEDRIRFLAGAQRFEVLGDAAERGVPAALDASDERPGLS